MDKADNATDATFGDNGAAIAPNVFGPTQVPDDNSEQDAAEYVAEQLRTWCGICNGTGTDNGRQCNCLRSERTYTEAADVMKAAYMAGYQARAMR